jgi:serine/threonine-protein kinase
MNFEIGSTVGDYQVVGILGAGGMGQVYKVRNVISDRVEAMKVLLPNLADQPELADRFLREIKVQASLEHPNIAGLHTAVRVENQLLMLTELVEGVTLAQKLKYGPLPFAEAVDYIMQALAALEYAHARGVVHRDIKPGNMMLTPEGVVKLMDFGIARSSDDLKLTQTGTTVGSLYYMSPEQIQGTAEPDARSDLYSVGVSLYELVTGKRPFDGDSQFAIMTAHLQGTPVPPVTVDPRLPKMLNDLILMAVAKDANARFQTAAALRNALSNVVSGPKPAATAAAAVVVPVAAAAAAPPPARAPAPAAAAAAVPVGAAVKPMQPVSHRGAWMGLGAVVAVLAIVAVIAIAPWKKTGAAPAKVDAPAAQAAPAEPPAPVAEQPPPAQTPAAQPEPQAQTPGAAPPPVSTPVSAAPRAASRPAAAAKSVPAASRPLVSQPAAQQPVAEQPPPPPPPVQQPAPQQPAAPVGPSRAELQEVRESVALINVRASGIRSSLQSLQRAQGGRGLNLRGDMQAAANLMNTYLEGAEAALNAGDVAQAKTFLEKAEPQVQKLENFFNR